MQIAILALGSQGDVQPYVALGRGLQEAGHSLRLITHENYAGFVTSHGLEFWPARGDAQAAVNAPELRALVEKGNFIALTRHTAKLAAEAALQWGEDSLAACDGVELLLAGIGGLNVAIALAEKRGIPLLQAYVLPFTPTSAFPGVLFPPTIARLGGFANRISHHLVRQVMWQGFRAADGRMRREVLGLPPAPFAGPYRAQSLRGTPVLYGFSPSVIPKPADWGVDVHVTGYWTLDPTPDWMPPPALVDFLASGPPPVYVGFGSMGNRNPEETAALVLRAIKQTGQRAVLLSGWGGLAAGEVAESVFLVDSVPHAWLFPRMAAVVHHGGAGTTGAGLTAGVPSIVIPFFGDQPFWGKRVAELGVGPAPIPRQQLSVERLAQAIQQAVSDQPMRQAAARLGEKIRAEDGVAAALALVGQMEKSGRSRLGSVQNELERRHL